MALSTHPLSGENCFGSTHLEKFSYCKQWFLHSHPFLHGPQSQSPLGTAPQQVLRKGLPSFPPMLENLMLDGKVAGSTVGLGEALRERHPLSLSFLPVLLPSGGEKPHWK